MDAELAAAMAQFGTAGLVGWLWLSERRSAGERERQLREVHERLVQERAGFEVVVKALTNNTRALSAVEAGQREVARSVERVGEALGRGESRGGRAA